MARRARWHQLLLLAGWLALATGVAAQVAAPSPQAPSPQAPSPQAASETLSVPALLARLDQLAAAFNQQPADAGVIRGSRVPPAWDVVHEGRTFNIPTSPIKTASEALERGDADADDRLKDAGNWIRALATELRASTVSAESFAASRDTLNDVLSAREFRNVKTPGLADTLRDRVRAWLIALLGRIFGSSLVPTITNGLVYLLIAIAVIVVALAFYRSIRTGVSHESVAAGIAAHTPREWREWRAEANRLNASGDWRGAMHALYWCAVSFLEARGAWRADRARTPREYAALLGDDRDRQRLLLGLTGQFERTWYAGQPADATLVADAAQTLERLGCPPS